MKISLAVAAAATVDEDGETQEKQWPFTGILPSDGHCRSRGAANTNTHTFNTVLRPVVSRVSMEDFLRRRLGDHIIRICTSILDFSVILHTFPSSSSSGGTCTRKQKKVSFRLNITVKITQLHPRR